VLNDHLHYLLAKLHKVRPEELATYRGWMDVFDELRIFRQICKCECLFCTPLLDQWTKRNSHVFPFLVGFSPLRVCGSLGHVQLLPTDRYTDTIRNDEKLLPGNAKTKRRENTKRFPLIWVKTF